LHFHILPTEHFSEIEINKCIYVYSICVLKVDDNKIHMVNGSGIRVTFVGTSQMEHCGKD